jgi:hypothetical protein
MIRPLMEYGDVIWNNCSELRRSKFIGTYPVRVFGTKLGFHGLNEYLFKINCLSSPLCHCGMSNESVQHYFLHCPRFAAQRNLFLTSAVWICGQS